MRNRSTTLITVIGLAFAFLGYKISLGQQPQLVVQTGHSNSVTSVANSPDGRVLASNQAPPSASPEVFVPSGSAGMNSLAYSPDGSLLAGGSFDNTVKVFDVRANIELRKFAGHENPITGVAILPDNETVISGSEDGTIRLWSLTQGIAIRTIPVGLPVASLGLSGDGRLLAVAANSADTNQNKDFQVLLWDVRHREWRPPLKGHDAKILSVAVNQDGKLIASGDAQHTIKLWNGETGSELRTINVDKGLVYSLAFNADATMLAGGIAFVPWTRTVFANDPQPAQPQSHDGEARVWVLPTGELKRTVRLTVVDEVSVAIHPNRPQIATARRIRGLFVPGEGRTGNRVQIWNIATGKEDRLEYTDMANSVAFNPDGKTLAVAAKLSVKTFNSTTGRVVREIGGFIWGSLHLNYLRNDRLMIDVRDRKNIVDLQRDALIEKSPCHEPRYFGDAAYYSGERRPFAVCSPDERTLARILNTEPVVEIVEADSGKVSHRLPMKADSLSFIAGGRTLAIWTPDGVEIRDVASGELRSRFAVAKSEANWRTEFSPRGEYLLTNNFSKADQTNDLHVYGTLTGQELYVKKNFPAFGQANCFFSPDDHAFAALAGTKVVVYEMKTGRELFTLPGQLGLFGSVVFSPNGKIIVQSGSRLQLWNGETGAEIGTLDGHVGRINKVKFSPDGKSIVTAGEDRTVKFWDLEKKTVINTLAGHTAGVMDVVFSPDGTRLATSGTDARTMLWRIDGQPIVTFFRTNEGELITITPDNYYHAPPSALPAIAFRLGRRVVPLSQFDLKLNRPDIVLERLGSTDSRLIDLYRKAYQRRLRRLGFSENQLGDDPVLPEVTISPSNIPATTQESKLSVKVRMNDALHKLATLSAILNDVPIFGKKGFDLSGKASRTHEQELTLELSQGRNRIEVFATNELGVESLRETVEIEYAGTETVKPDLYIAVIGVSKYETPAYKLNYAAKDAADVASSLEASNQKAFNHIYVRPFLDGDAKRENILSLREFFRGSKVNDEIVLFVSGHGLLDENAQYYFATPDIDFLKPQERGISYDELEDILDGVPARRKLLLLDTCHAGEADPEGAVFATPQTDPKPSAGTVVKYAPRDVHIRAIKFADTDEFLKQAFADLRRGTGTAVIGAAGASAFAFESDQWKNGVFTFSILSGLKTGLADLNRDGETTTNELQQFVGAEVSRLTNGAQKPVARQEHNAFDFALARNPQLVRKLPHSGSGVYAVAWSPDGSRLATTAEDGAIRIWKPGTGELDLRISSDANVSTVLKWTADGSMVLVDVWKNVNFYDAARGELRRSIKTDNTYLSDFVLTRDEQSIVANGDAWAVTKYRTATGELTGTFEKHRSQVRIVTLDADEKFMASGEDNGSIYIWDLTNDKRLHLIADAHQSNVTSLQFYREGGELRLVSSGAEGTLRFWNPVSGEALQTIKTDQGQKDSVTCLAFSRDEGEFATGHTDGTIRVWRTARHTLIETIMAHPGAIRGLSFNLDGQILASTGGDGTARLWRLAR